MEYQIGDSPVTVREMMIIWEATNVVIQMIASQVIVESGSQVAINAITGWSQTPKLIGNLVRDIKKYFTFTTNIQFVYYSREIKGLAYRKAKVAHLYIQKLIAMKILYRVLFFQI